MCNDSWGLTFVHYLEIEVSFCQRSGMYGVHAFVGRGHGVCPLVGGCLLVFGVSIIGGSTVHKCLVIAKLATIPQCVNCCKIQIFGEWERANLVVWTGGFFYIICIYIYMYIYLYQTGTAHTIIRSS